MLVFCDASDTLGKACLEQVEMIAPLYRGTFLFVSVSHQELHLYHTFGIKIGTPHPQLVILNITNDQELTKFVLDADTFTAMSQQDSQNDNAEGFAQIKKDRDGTFLLTEDAIHRFLKMYLSNDLLPYYRSEENAHASVADSSVEEENSGDKDAVATSVDQERYVFMCQAACQQQMLLYQHSLLVNKNICIHISSYINMCVISKLCPCPL